MFWYLLRLFIWFIEFKILDFFEIVLGLVRGVFIGFLFFRFRINLGFFFELFKISCLFGFIDMLFFFFVFLYRYLGRVFILMFIFFCFNVFFFNVFLEGECLFRNVCFFFFDNIFLGFGGVIFIKICIIENNVLFKLFILLNLFVYYMLFVL